MSAAIKQIALYARICVESAYCFLSTFSLIQTIQ